MSKKDLKELRNLTNEELNTRLRENESKLFKDRMQHVLGQLENVKTLWKSRKEIARIKTLMTEKQRSAGVK